MRSEIRVVLRALVIGLVAVTTLNACGSDDDAATSPERLLLVPEGNRLWGFALDEPSRQQVVIPSANDDPANGRDINGQVCISADGRRFIAGEDTGQPDPPAGWGVFELHGDMVGELSATQVGKLTVSFQGATQDNAEPYGCGFLSDGRLVTTDVGNQAVGPPTGQLILWFPPLDAPNPRSCKLDVAIGTANGIFVDENDNVYVASARADPGIYRYAPPFPTSDDAAGGCGRMDESGAPLVTEDLLNKEKVFPTDNNIPTPNGLVRTADGNFLVSSIINGVIAEYDADGTFVGRILQPPAGETLGDEPYSTGTPLGIGIDKQGTVYYADLGLIIGPRGPGPGPRTGTVRRIRFADGEPLPPETFLDGLSFPDGVGVFDP